LLEAKGSQTNVVAFPGAGKELEKENIKYKTSSAYLSKKEYERLENEAMMLAKSLGTRKFDGDKSLVKLLEYNNTSLYWLVELDIYFHLSQVCRYLENLIRIIEEEKPGRIVAIEDNSLLTKGIIAVAKANGIPTQLLPLGWRYRAKIVVRSAIQALLPIPKAYLREIRDFLRRRLWYSPMTGSAIKGKKESYRKIFFAPSGREREAIDPASGRTVREDSVLGPLVRQLESDSANKIVVQYRFSSPFQLRLPTEMKRNKRVTYMPSEYYLTSKIRQAISRETRLLRSKWKELENNEKFRALLTYRGVNLWDMFREELRGMFYQGLPTVVKYIELSKQIIETEKPDIVVTANENTQVNRSLIVASNSKNIPVLAMQHGAMLANALWMIAYGCSADELNSSPSKNSVFPARLAIYGEDTRNILKAIAYPFEERIVITGPPQYDILANSEKVFDRERFCASWKIDPSKKIVLIGSQTFHIAGNRESFCRSIFQALKDDPELQIVIKPHPTEPEEWYEKLAGETGARVVPLPRNSDTYEALYACDVLITFYSTIALEAMILGKPVITLNLTNQPDPMPYASSNAAFGVYKAEDIAPAVKKVLEDSETRKGLELGREKYLYRQFYKLDGQATKRVVDLIYDIIKTKNSAN